MSHFVQKQQRCTSAPGFHPDWAHRFRRRRLRSRRCRRRIRPTRTLPKRPLCPLGSSCQSVSPWDRLCPGVRSTTRGVWPGVGLAFLLRDASKSDPAGWARQAPACFAPAPGRGWSSGLGLPLWRLRLWAAPDPRLANSAIPSSLPTLVKITAT